MEILTYGKLLIILILLIPLSTAIKPLEKEPIGICNYYYWFNFDSNNCGYSEFCGQYMYYGLNTFDTKKECKIELKDYRKDEK